MKRIIPIAVVIWLVALTGTLVFRGNTWANSILLVVSIGLIFLGWKASRKN
jgi:hypothetical protein